MAMWKHVVHFDVTVQYSVITENDVHQSQFPNPNTRPPPSSDILQSRYNNTELCHANQV